jgi:hypothetical protein
MISNHKVYEPINLDKYTDTVMIISGLLLQCTRHYTPTNSTGSPFEGYSTVMKMFGYILGENRETINI